MASYEHAWTVIEVNGEPWEVSRDAVRVGGVRINPTPVQAEKLTLELGGVWPLPVEVIDARWEAADLKNRFHCQKLWEGENDGPLHSRLIDQDITAHGSVPRIVGNPGKCWGKRRPGGTYDLYGVFAPAAEATLYRGTLLCWGLPVYESESDETDDLIAQRSSDSSHRRGHHDYMTTLTLGRPLGSPDTLPAPPVLWHEGMDLPSLTLGQRCCGWLGAQFHLAPREIPGPEHEPLILSYSEHCRRGGRLLGVTAGGLPIWDGGSPLALRTDDSASPWCAALASATELCALLPGETPPHSLRVSVRELVEDARLAQTLRPAHWQPTPGALAILGRSGYSPMIGGPGHTRCMIQLDGERYFGCGGNEADTISIGWHPRSAVLAWVAR